MWLFPLSLTCARFEHSAAGVCTVRAGRMLRGCWKYGQKVMLEVCSEGDAGSMFRR